MISRMVASAGGVGFAPKAPGTAGSVLGLALGALAMTGPWWALPALALGTVAAGLLAIPHAVTDPKADPGWVVIDEVAGQCIALLGLGAAPIHSMIPGLAAAFVLFRALDIWKPGPVGWMDRQHGAFGIMMDDVVAGLIAAAVLLAARWAGIGGLG